MPRTQFPSQILFDFFREASERLGECSLPRRVKERASASTTERNDGDDDVPPSLEAQRCSLLRVQVEALAWSVERNNDVARRGDGHVVTLENAQAILRQLGARDFSHIDPGDEDGLTKAMAAMNAAARRSFARSVLRAEILWEESNREGDRGTAACRALVGATDSKEMDRSAILEFCGLSNAAVGLPEVKEYLRNGADMTSSHDGEFSLFEGKGVIADVQNRSKADCAAETPQRRLELLQRYFLRAVGYDPDYAISEIQRQLTNTSPAGANSVGDSELTEIFAKFLSNMSVAVTNASFAGACLSPDSGSKLSDQESGGVTRVVSVEYSEKFVVGGDGEGTIVSGAPSQASMEQHVEAKQKKQLAMAREAVVLQETIVNDLLSMDVSEREELLAKAEEAHHSFLQEALAIPAGPERVFFLQSVDSEKQKLLAIHKLWEQWTTNSGEVAPEN